jgi:hypothetical protein
MLADTHELAQDERRVVRPALRDHKLHAGSIHPIPEGRDHSKVSHTQQGIKFILLQGLVAIFDLRQTFTFALEEGRETTH